MRWFPGIRFSQTYSVGVASFLYHVHLLQDRLSRKDGGSTTDQFTQDTTGGPDVHGTVVLPTAIQNFRCSVPTSRDVIGEGWSGTNFSGLSKVSQLQSPYCFGSGGFHDQ